MPSTAMITRIFKQCTGFQKGIHDLVIRSARDGNCEGELKIGKEHSNMYGRLHGGCAATLIDVISCAGLMSLNNMADSSYLQVTVGLNLSYLKDGKVGDDIIISSKTMKAGKHLAFLDAEIKNKATGEVLVKGIQCMHTKYI